MTTFYVRCQKNTGEGYTLIIEAPGPLVAAEIARDHYKAWKVLEAVPKMFKIL